MKVEYINCFIEACQKVIKNVLKSRVMIGKPYAKLQKEYRCFDISVIIGLTGEIRGQAVLTLQKIDALQVIKLMSSDLNLTQWDEIGKSALGELCNIIMGNASTILAQKKLNVNITPPMIIEGKEIKFTVINQGIICIPIVINQSCKIELHISFEEENI